MGNRIILGTVSLALLLGGCASPPASPEPAETVAETTTAVETTEAPEPTDEATSEATEAPDDATAGQLIPQEQQIFYNENGEAQTYQELVDSRVLSVQEYTGPDATRAIFAGFDEMVSHFISEEEVRHNLNLAEGEELTQEHYEAVSVAYAQTFDSLFTSPSRELYDKIHQLRDQATYEYLLAQGNEDGIDAKINIVYDGITGFDVTNNSTEIAFLEDTPTRHYEMTWDGEGIHKSDFTPSAHWQIDGNVNVTETE